MKAFAALLETLIHTPSRNRKIEALVAYFRDTPDPDRGLGLAAITRDLRINAVKPAALKDMVRARVDPVLFDLSYDYVGDLAETIALIWPTPADGTSAVSNGASDVKNAGDLRGALPALSNLLVTLEATPKGKAADLMAEYFDHASPNERWAMIKLITGGLRVGVSARLAKTALAEFGGQSLEELERLWHGLSPPYTEVFAWLEGRGDKPQVNQTAQFHPMMLANPIDEDKDFPVLDPADFAAEWKWDGIRVQLVAYDGTARIFSRTGEEISHTFPDVVQAVIASGGQGVLDGELLVGKDFQPLPFNCLQQRLNRKTLVKKHLADYPAFIRAYDILFNGHADMRDVPWAARRTTLDAFVSNHPCARLDISPLVEFDSWDALAALRQHGADAHGHEGLMLKRRDSLYVAGRPKGPWFKWKRDPKLVDAILMYAQRGHGKRSSFYSDFTFGVWRGNEIVPIGKAYFGFTDEELKQLDKWVRANTIQSFGPVREVEKQVVLEIAFDSAHESPRHKSGIALRFPRIARIRWDKPVQEVEDLAAVKAALLG